MLIWPYTMLAHHGGSGSYDSSKPLYLKGTVLSARYGQPHGTFKIRVPADLQVPADLGDVARLRGHDTWDAPPSAVGAGEDRELLLPPDLTAEVDAMARRPGEGDEIAALVYQRCDTRGPWANELRVQMLYASDRVMPYRGTATRFTDGCPGRKETPPAGSARPTGAARREDRDTRSDADTAVWVGGGAAAVTALILVLIRLRTRRVR